MNTDNKISRKDFIKTSTLTGVALLASMAISGQAMNLLQEQTCTRLTSPSPRKSGKRWKMP